MDRWNNKLQLLDGVARVSLLIEVVMGWARNGSKWHMEDMQVFLAEEEKLTGRVGIVR